MKILLTGATGTIGSEVARQLSSAGIPFRALVRNTAKADALKGNGNEIVEGDYEDKTSIEKALAGIETAFMLPPLGAPSVPQQGDFIEIAKKSGVKRIVKLSAMGADVKDKHPSRLIRWHYEAEEILKASGMPYTNVEPNSFMQNAFPFAPTIKEQGMIFAPGGDAKVSHVDVRDIASVIVAALTQPGHEGKTYVLTGPEAISYQQVAEKIGAAIGKSVNYVPIAPEQFKQGATQFGVPEWLADGLNELYGWYRQGGGELVTTDVTDVIKRPAITFDQFANDFAVVFK